MNKVEPNRNVYIGHRYVPLLVGEWDKSVSYEGLSIVTYQGTSYTSKKRVPVGIDIGNEEFWVVTGNYNAQVEYYRDETERVSQELTKKSDKTYVDTELGKKSDKTYVDTELDIKQDNINQISHVPPIHAFDNIADGINAFYQSLPDGAWMKIPAGEYNYNKTIVFDREINVDLTGAIMTYEGSTDQPALIIGKEEEGIRHFNIIGTYIRRDSENKYADTSEVGIKVINVSYSKIDLSAFNFYRGVELTSGNGFGNVYNQYNLGWLYDNMESLVITTFNSTGWTNENNFYGGGFQITSSASTPEHRHLVIEHKHDYRNNNNKFYGPSFEDTGRQCTAIDTNGANTYFFAPRFEGARIVNIGEHALDNIIMFGMGTDSINVTGLAHRLSIYGNRYKKMPLDGRGLNYNLNSLDGNIMNFKSQNGNDVFNITGRGDVKARSIEVNSKIHMLSDKAIGMGSSIENFQHSVGSLFIDHTGSLNGLKYKLWGEADSTTGWEDIQIVHSASTNSRPSDMQTGFTMFDSTLNKPIWWNGSVWVDSNGDTV